MDLGPNYRPCPHCGGGTMSDFALKQHTRTRHPSPYRATLNVRDEKVAAMTRAGLSAPDIARKLDLSVRHVVRLRSALRAKGRLR